jgi:hypothetical protein
VAIDTSGIRHSIILLTADVPEQARELKAFAPFARVGRLGTHAVSYAAMAPEVGLARLPALNEVPQVG